ncbi:MAG: hypothetical protein M3374_05935 [Pseudomonadota bacterium]|nr:hypothetical protein [Pseudomonadota bacterium]
MSGSPSNWLDRLAHDLRGPLSPVQTAVFLLRDMRVAETERIELLDVIDRQASRLSGMMDEISDWVRAENGRLLARREAVDLELLLEDTAAGLRTPPQVVIAPGLQVVELHGDVLRLGQLMRCLFEYRLTRADVTPARVEISWAAPGRMRLVREIDGVDAAELLADSILSAPHPEPLDEGLGLAMLIARAIAEAHGGELQAQAGTPGSLTLVLELPAQAAASQG